ncbi:hypothetical protein ACFV2N_26965 [Streptomyces sp. NPDC059680]|uniref:hypothetical protein n=1 Tax=Streptomyces sp. NPDC059680 TaxID=3346904 RepID=UPI0036BBAF54
MARPSGHGKGAGGAYRGFDHIIGCGPPAGGVWVTSDPLVLPAAVAGASGRIRLGHPRPGAAPYDPVVLARPPDRHPPPTAAAPSGQAPDGTARSSRPSASPSPDGPGRGSADRKPGRLAEAGLSSLASGPSVAAPALPDAVDRAVAELLTRSP